MHVLTHLMVYIILVVCIYMHVLTHLMVYTVQ